MSNLIILNDLPTYNVPSKTAGAYRIASSCRQFGHSVDVIDHLSYLFEKAPEVLFQALDRSITKKTYAVAVSGSWFSGLSFDYKEQDLDLTDKEKQYFRLKGYTPTLTSIIYSESKWFTLFHAIFKHLTLHHPQVKIILGGHTSGSMALFNSFGNKPFNFIDHWIKGFGESAMIQLLNNCKLRLPNPADKILPGDPMGLLYDFHSCPPMFHKYDMIMPKETLPLELSRGCRFKCKFCSYPLLGKNPKEHRYLRSKESIKKELKFNYNTWGITNYFVLCDTFNETNEKLQTLADAVSELGIQLNLTAYLRLDLVYAHRDIQIPLLKQVGLRFANFGIESLHDPSAKAIGKGMGKQKTIEALALMKKEWNNEIHLHGNFVVGLPHETIDTITANNQELLDGQIGLDSYTWHSLSIVKNRGKNRSFSSEFDRNYEKYGYQVSDTLGSNGNIWKNEHWDSVKTDELAKQWNKESREQNKTKLDAWRMASILNYGYTWKEALTKYHTDLTSPEFVQDKNKFYDQYIKLVKRKYSKKTGLATRWARKR